VHAPVHLALKKPQKIFPNLVPRATDHKHKVYQSHLDEAWTRLPVSTLA
jgi:hypothetical protein